ncbi:MAG: T9SS type A sorting domain-containing protein [Bacteroidetes bacterium]|nr:T9SS type A sorting domain-containing protein [Bacteroidota bacterium]
MNDLFSIELNMKSKTNVTINLLDVSGKLIREIANEEANSGIHKVSANLSSIPSGVYTVQILSDGKSINKRINIAH